MSTKFTEAELEAISKQFKEQEERDLKVMLEQIQDFEIKAESEFESLPIEQRTDALIARFAAVSGDDIFNKDTPKSSSTEQRKKESKRSTERYEIEQSQKQIQMVKDAELARQLSLDGQKNQMNNKKNREALINQLMYIGAVDEAQKLIDEDLKKEAEAASDAAVAQTLQMLENEGQVGMSRSELLYYQNGLERRKKISSEEWKQMAINLQAILNSNAVVGDPIVAGQPLTDAHKYTTTDIRNGIPVLYGIADKFNLSSFDLSCDQVLKEVLEYIDSIPNAIGKISVDHVKTTFAKITSNPAFENESQTNAHHLLSRTWSLAKKLGNEYKAAIAACLSDNIGDGGGCIAGLVARLYSPYAKMIGLELALKPTVKREAPKKI